jgi:fimbrial chaperone protein
MFMQKINIRDLACSFIVSFIVFLSVAGNTFAGSFVVSPQRVTLSTTQPFGAVLVRNDGTEPTVVQLDASSWSQKDGVTVLHATNEIVTAPALLTLQPGESQTVRIGLRRSPDPKRELTYRLTLREIPHEKDAQSRRKALQVSVPVFVASAGESAARLVWTVNLMPDGKLEVLAKNEGNAHVQVGNFTLSMATDGTLIARQQAAEYVLPGNTRAWRITSEKAVAPGEHVRIVAQTDAGEIPTLVAMQIGPDTQAMAH